MNYPLFVNICRNTNTIILLKYFNKRINLKRIPAKAEILLVITITNLYSPYDNI